MEVLTEHETLKATLILHTNDLIILMRFRLNERGGNRSVERYPLVPRLDSTAITILALLGESRDAIWLPTGGIVSPIDYKKG